MPFISGHRDTGTLVEAQIPFGSMVRFRIVGPFLLSVVVLISFPSCNNFTNPVRPTPGSPTPAGAFALSVTAPGTASELPWHCFAAGSSVLPAADCPTIASRPIRQLGVTGAALSADIPRNLAASVSGTTVTLTWQTSTSGVPLSSYVLQAGSATGLANLANYDTGSTALTFRATDVAPGTYFVRILANYYGALSAPSNEVIVSVSGGPPACGSAPNAPTNPVITANGSSVTLTWGVPSGCAPTGYVIEAGSATGLVNLANFNTGNSATGFTATGVVAGTYFVRVRSINAAGISGPSNEVTIIVGASCTAAPGVPGFLGWTTAGAPGALQFFWGAASGVVSSYVVELGTTAGATNIGVADTGSAATSYAITGLASGDYYGRVRAKNPCGISGPSNEAVPRVR